MRWQGIELEVLSDALDGKHSRETQSPQQVLQKHQVKDWLTVVLGRSKRENGAKRGGLEQENSC